ncbi:MAG: hypothetical protein ABI285_03385 [Ginsengibacter sp.]
MMKSFFAELKKRNAALCYFGWLMFLGFIFSFVASFFDSRIILGINAWIKPMKFYLSITIMTWTIGWLAWYLKYEKKVKIYSWVLVLAMTIEMIIISFQAARGQRSHFNVSSAFNAMLFTIMGISITIFAVWTAYICVLFFMQKEFDISNAYLLSIKLGLILFVLFAFEGWVIVGNLGHTIGAADGSPGLPFVNWSKRYGDLRVAHFFGMHALQILPLTGYYLARKTSHVIVFAIVYFLFVTILLLLAIGGIPFIK